MSDFHIGVQDKHFVEDSHLVQDKHFVEDSHLVQDKHFVEYNHLAPDMHLVEVVGSIEVHLDKVELEDSLAGLEAVLVWMSLNSHHEESFQVHSPYLF